MTRDEFLAEIETYLRATGMAPTPFGKAVAGDPGFVSRVRAGGDVTLRIVERTHVFMAENPPAKADPVCAGEEATPNEDAA